MDYSVLAFLTCEKNKKTMVTGQRSMVFGAEEQGLQRVRPRSYDEKSMV